MGPFIFVDKHLAESQEEIAHKVDGHTVDSKFWGPFYLITYGIPSLLNTCFKLSKCHYDFYTEMIANHHANLYADKDCILHFRKINPHLK